MGNHSMNEAASKIAVAQTLVSKLAEACDAVGGVEKKGRNQAQGYDYIKAADVAKAIRHELFNRGIVIIPNEVECVTERIEFVNARGETRHSNEVKLKTCYVITDGSDKIEMYGYGIAWDSGDKAIYKAKTGALKYFLRGLGLIPDEKDDPEADTETESRIATATKRFEDARISAANIRRFWTEARKTGKTNEQVAAYLADLGHSQTEHLRQSEYQAALDWASKTITVTPQTAQESVGALQASLAMVEAQKASKGPANAKERVIEAVREVKAGTQAAKVGPDPFWKNFWVMAAKHNIPEGDIHQYAKDNFGMKASLKELDQLQIGQLIGWVTSIEP